MAPPSDKRPVQAFISLETHRKMRILCAHRDESTSSWIVGLIEDAIEKNLDENGKLILDDDDF